MPFNNPNPSTPNSTGSYFGSQYVSMSGMGSGLGTPQLPLTPRPLRPRPLPLESPGFFDFMDPNLTPIDQELKAGGFGMFHGPGGMASPSPGRGSPSVRDGVGEREMDRAGSSGGTGTGTGAGTGAGKGTGTGRAGKEGKGKGKERENADSGMEWEEESENTDDGPYQKRSAGLLNFSSAELEGLSSAQLYDLNQALLDDSVPTRPLINSLTPMSSLREEYENGNPNFVRQIDWLMEKGYKFVRRTRGDGDCFYRSLAFAYLHSLIHSSDKDLSVAQALSTLSQTPELLDSAGIEKMVYEDFYDEFVGLVEGIVNKDMRDEELLRAFQNPEVSNAVVIYLRFVTSAHIRMNPDQFEGFVEHPDTREPMDVESYCANFVQAMGKEADNVEIQALVSVLQLNVDVAYLNGGQQRVVDFIEFRNGFDRDEGVLVLLYRPGHYDVLSKTG